MRLYKAKIQIETCFYSEETSESELSIQAMQAAEEEFELPDGQNKLKHATRSLISTDVINSMDDVPDRWIDLVPWLGKGSSSWFGSDPTVREFLTQEGTA